MFVVEDGTGLTNSNSYVSVADFKEYWADRGVDYSAVTDSEIQASLVKATQYLDTNFRWIGKKQTAVQALQWPRWYAYSPEGYIYSGVPRDVMLAVCEAGAVAQGGASLFASSEGGVSEKTENVGPIQTTYKYAQTMNGRVVYQAIQVYIKDLVQSRPNAVVRRY